MIHREGYASIAIGTLVFVGLAWLLNHFLWPSIPVLVAATWALALAMVVLVVQFFRNPKRSISPNENQILAPADGKVVIIQPVDEPEFFQAPRIQISIFMSPLNVHVNRNPISGRVVYQKYHAGKFLVAWHPKSSTDNERTTVVIEDSRHRQVLFRQIAGAVARRVVCYAKEGQAVQQGAEMGFIKCGSRVEVFLPLGSQVLVQIGQNTTGGQTVLANLA